MAGNFKLNFPIETDEAWKFWESRHRLNRIKAIIAFSLDLDNANDNLRRAGYYRQYRKKYLEKYRCYVRHPTMLGIPFSGIDEPWWEPIQCTPLGNEIDVIVSLADLGLTYSGTNGLGVVSWNNITGVNVIVSPSSMLSNGDTLSITLDAKPGYTVNNGKYTDSLTTTVPAGTFVGFMVGATDFPATSNSRDTLTITWKNGIGPYTVTLIDDSDNTIRNAVDLPDGVETYTFFVKDLPSGKYHAHVKESSIVHQEFDSAETTFTGEDQIAFKTTPNSGFATVTSWMDGAQNISIRKGETVVLEAGRYTPWTGQFVGGTGIGSHIDGLDASKVTTTGTGNLITLVGVDVGTTSGVLHPGGAPETLTDINITVTDAAFTIPGFDTTHIYPVDGVEGGFIEAEMGTDYEIAVIADDESLLTAQGVSLTWRVDPIDLAKVTVKAGSNGVKAIISPLKEGSGRVYCKWTRGPDSDEKSSSLTVNAKVVLPDWSVDISASDTVTLGVDAGLNWTATGIPKSEPGLTHAFSSSDTNVFTVINNSLIRPVSLGTANLILNATYAGANYNNTTHTETKSIEVVAPVAPTFTKQPVATATVMEGHEITLESMATGAPNTKYLWSKFNTSLNSWDALSTDAIHISPTSHDLRMIDVTPAQSGRYRVRATNAGLFTDSTECVLTVTPLLVWSTDLTADEANYTVGDAITLTVGTSGGTPPVNHYWYKEGSTTPIVGAGSSNTFRINSAKTTDTGVYYVFAEDNTAGTKQRIESTHKQITVTAAPTPPPAPTITTPAGQTVEYVGDQELSVGSAGEVALTDPKPGDALVTGLQIQYDNSNVWHDASAEGPAWAVDTDGTATVTPDDNGRLDGALVRFSAYATNNIGNSATVYGSPIAIAWTLSELPPAPTDVVLTPDTVSEGSSFTAEVNHPIADAYPGISYVWFRTLDRTSFESIMDDGHFSGSETKVLTRDSAKFGDIPTGDSGEYVCFVGNKEPGKATNYAPMVGATLTVTAAPVLSITQQPVATLSETVGGTITMSVVASVTNNGTAPTYQWKKNGTDISGATSSTYTKSDVDVSDSGSYTCEVTSTGSTNSPVTSDECAVSVNLGVITFSSPATGTLGVDKTVTATSTSTGSVITYEMFDPSTTNASIDPDTGVITTSSASDDSATTFTVIVTAKGTKGEADVTQDIVFSRPALTGFIFDDGGNDQGLTGVGENGDATWSRSVTEANANGLIANIKPIPSMAKLPANDIGFSITTAGAGLTLAAIDTDNENITIDGSALTEGNAVITFTLDGTTISRTLKVHITPPPIPVIKTQPASVSVAKYSPAELTVVAHNAGDENDTSGITYQWQSYVDIINQWINVAAPDAVGSVTDATLKYIAIGNSTRFRCNVTNPLQTVTSNEATVTTTAGTTTDMGLTGPDHGVINKDVTFNWTGGTAPYTLLITSTDGNVIYNRNNEVSGKTVTITLRNFTADTNAIVHLTDSTGKTQQMAFAYKLTEPFSFKTNLTADPVTLHVGGPPLDLTVEVQGGKPPYTFSWRNGSNGLSGSVDTATTSTYTIDTSVAHAGRFHCFVTDSSTPTAGVLNSVEKIVTFA